ncbi:MAG: class I SAM-dependent methyltransferase [Chitinispirillaceae bacterium]|nr:class I SAM-dependent methyltransferase [Chitinispirillaceae bacterium]
MLTNRQHQRLISDYYDAEAPLYAEKYHNELDTKPYDRYILSRFSNYIPPAGIICEIGCGPGQVSGYLNKGNKTIFGLDLSLCMLNEAKKSHHFDDTVKGDYFTMPFRDESLDGILAFYSIVHDETTQIEQLLYEIRRVLKMNGKVLLSFHTGNERISTSNKKDSIEYIFHDTEQVYDYIIESEFLILEGVVRLPYPDAEFPSKRTYFLLEKD